MKYLLVLFISLISTIGFSQELNVGVELGQVVNYKTPTVGASIEYRPYKSMVSINANPYLLMGSNHNPILTLPLYLKFNFGKRIKVCPDLGAYIRSIGNHGLITGLTLEYNILDNFWVYTNGSYMTENYKQIRPGKFGGSNEYWSSESLYMFSIGVKKNIFRKPIEPNLNNKK
jgi:hypothetical protein